MDTLAGTCDVVPTALAGVTQLQNLQTNFIDFQSARNMFVYDVKEENPGSHSPDQSQGTGTAFNCHKGSFQLFFVQITWQRRQ